MHPLRSLCLRVFVSLTCFLLVHMYVASPSIASASDSVAVAMPHPQPVPVVMWNRTIVVFRTNYEEFTPAERARFAKERMNQIPADLPEYRVAAVDVIEAGHRLALVKVNGRIMFSVIDGEQDSANGETYELCKERVVKALEGWLLARKAQFGIPLLLRAAGFAVLVTLLFSIAVFAVSRSILWLLNRLGHLGSGNIRHFVFAGLNIGPYLVSLATGLVKIFKVLLLLFLAYLWLAILLSLFPYTSPWASELSGFLLDTLTGFGHGLMSSIPGLFVIGVIVFMTRLLVSLVTAFFRSIEEETTHLSWFEPETAKATRRIVVVLIWIFALIVAYPLIPGSQSKIFQGVSVFLGLMLSLGSAGLVGQLIGGIVAVYTRAFKQGDYVRIGEHEGVVHELGILASKLVTIRCEEVTIPNALLMSSTTINYSRQSRQEGAIVATGVTIGYDAPWRQVHAMLQMAAGKTKGIRTSPAPFVLQKALSDFYVEYTLMFRIDRPEERYFILSELHGHVQDVFNEYGVQIMSPNFVMQPDKEVVVPKAQWFEEPGAREVGRGGSND